MEIKPLNPRSRSNTAVSNKGKERTLSRASTTSIHSGPTQPPFEQPLVDPAFQKQWYEANAQADQRYGTLDNQMTAEDMVMHSASQLQNPREYDIDPALGGPVHHPMAYSQEAQYRPDIGRQSIPGDGYGANYGEGDSQLMEGRSDEPDDVDSLAGAGGPVKKGAKSSAANELEMRQLFQANKHRALPDVASELHGNERGPQSERQRQVFAMLWYVYIPCKFQTSIPNMLKDQSSMRER